MDKIKELSKNPFKFKDKYTIELNIFNKIIDENNKLIESERDEKLLSEFNRILSKGKDALTNHIRGTVLKDLGYVEVAELFFNRAKELGYTVESKIILEDVYIDDNIEDVVGLVTDKLIGNYIQLETPYTNDITTSKIEEIDYDNLGVLITLMSGVNVYLTFLELNTLFDGNQVIKKINDTLNSIMLSSEDNTEDLVTAEVDELMAVENMNENFYDNLDNMYFRFSKGYKPEDDPCISDNIKLFIETLPGEYKREEVENYLTIFKTNDATLNPITNENLRSVSVTFEDDTIINTSMAQNLTDEQIYNYYAIGKEFNLGKGEDDYMSKVKSVTINENLNPNDYIQVMPYLKTSNYNVYAVEDEARPFVKPEFNMDAVKRMIEADSFLNFSYHNLLTGVFEEDMKLIYNSYIKKDEVYLNKLKQYESYSNLVKENILSTAKYSTILDEIINSFNIELGENKTDIFLNMANFIDDNKDKFRSYYALLTPNLKDEFKNKFNEISYVELTIQLLDSGFNYENEDIDNIQKLATSLDISEQLCLVLMNILKTVYLSYQYSKFTEDTNTNSILFMTIITIIFKAI